MILNAAELVAAALNELPSEIRTLVEAHFFDCESVFKIQRHHQMKRRDIEATIAAALANMRTTLRSRGFNEMSDLM